MSHSSKLISLSKPVVLLALVMFCHAGCGSRSPGPPVNVDAIKAQAHKLFTEGKFAEALGPARATVLAAETKYGKDSPELADCIAGVGRIQASLGNPAEAVIAFDQAAEIFRRVKVTGPQLAMPIIWSAANLQAMRKYDLAEERYLAGIKVLNDAGDENSFELVSAAVDYASLKIVRGTPQDAEDFLQMALKALKVSQDSNPNIYCRTLNNLGEIRFLRGDYQDALNYYQQELDMALEKIPEEQRMIAVFRKNVENAKGKMEK
jgi:tetratricopeptide (TPR) repeat protein